MAVSALVRAISSARAASLRGATTAASARAASALSATIGTSARRRRISAGSMSMRATFRPAGAAPQRDIGTSRRVPNATKQIGLRPKLVRRCDGEAERMPVIDDAASAAERHHRCVDAFSQRADLGRRMQRTATDPQHRRLRLVQQLRQCGDALGIGQRLRMSRQWILRGDFGRCPELVPRHFQRDRAGASRQHLLEGARGEIRGLARMLDALGPFQQAAQRGELVGQFVQLAAAAADHHAGHLAGQAQHRRIDAPGGGERGGGVEHAGTRHHGVGGGAAGRAGIAESHVGRGLLMARVDQAQAVGGAREKASNRP